MLQLKQITKEYKIDNDSVVKALRGIDLEFPKAQFTSILGPSGCGKTTMLNIIGGLDKYTGGDLMIDGKSTKDFKDAEWDAYRNSTIGFVFQSYNLISHQTVFDNVAIALTLSGISLEERKVRATEALTKVGLLDQLNKKPNQLSGGQMQRVAIARALVNNPKILMADEPTGALDSQTSIQIMEILKEISKEKLVIMVTHNQDLADEYSDRIIRLLDGKVIGDSKPQTRETADKTVETSAAKMVNKKTSMSFLTALKLSFKNLMTKKKRTILTSIAGSIGIIGVALVLALSSGMSNYVGKMQSDMLAGFPLTVSQQVITDRGESASDILGGGSKEGQFPEGDALVSYDSKAKSVEHTNIITKNYQDYLSAMDKSLYNAIAYSYAMNMNVLGKLNTSPESYKLINTSQDSGGDSGDPFDDDAVKQIYFSEIPDSEEFIKSQYDILYGEYPKTADELVLIVDKYNRLDVKMLGELGIEIKDNYTFESMIGKEYKVIGNNVFYQEEGGIYAENTDHAAMYNHASSFTIKIVGILRVNESASSELLNHGIGYTATLTQRMLADAQNSDVSIAQAASATSVIKGVTFNKYNTKESTMFTIGANATPIGIQIYPKGFESKDGIIAYLDAYNAGRPQAEQIVYTDSSASMMETISTMLSSITLVLAALAAVSLVVSTIMIGIITYVSVVERTKEIGILRAIGARKKDVSRIFNAETLLIGFVSGVLGVVVTYLVSIPVNIVVKSLVGIAGIASLPIWYAALLIAGSMALTLIGGFIPSSGAAKKDPVKALRTE